MTGLQNLALSTRYPQNIFNVQSVASPSVMGRAPWGVYPPDAMRKTTQNALQVLRRFNLDRETLAQRALMEFALGIRQGDRTPATAEDIMNAVMETMQKKQEEVEKTRDKAIKKRPAV